MILNVPGKLLPGSWYVPGRFRKKRPTICIKWSHLLLTGLFNVGEHKRAPMEFVLTQGPEQDLSAIFPGRKPALTPNLKPRIMQKLLFFRMVEPSVPPVLTQRCTQHIQDLYQNHALIQISSPTQKNQVPGTSLVGSWQVPGEFLVCFCEVPGKFLVGLWLRT